MLSGVGGMMEAESLWMIRTSRSSSRSRRGAEGTGRGGGGRVGVAGSVRGLYDPRDVYMKIIVWTTS